MTKQTTYILNEGSSTMTAVEVNGKVTSAELNTGNGSQKFSAEKAQHILHGYQKGKTHIDGALDNVEPGARDHLGSVDIATLTKIVTDVSNAQKPATTLDDALRQADTVKAGKTTYYDVPNGGESFLPVATPVQKSAAKGNSKH